LLITLHNIPGQKTSTAVLDTDAMDLNKMFTILSILISRTNRFSSQV